MLNRLLATRADAEQALLAVQWHRVLDSFKRDADAAFARGDYPETVNCCWHADEWIEAMAAA